MFLKKPLSISFQLSFLTGGKIEYFYDATGIKLKKKVTDRTTITTTEYMDTSTALSTGSFQYTNNYLDFFSHSEGYIKAVMSGNLGGTPRYEFRYVFNFTDHLSNIRLKYAQDPSNNNSVTILEVDHYYPYGLKHKGYSGNHLVFEGVEEPEGPGTGITLTPVNPFLGDSYKYKFGGMEYQDEFDINTYDFGARNYDPVLGRWMNIDPLAEFMRRHSPYNYAFNNPVYFIDPDGMAPGGFSGQLGLTDMSIDFGSGNESGALKGGGDSENKIEAAGLNADTSAPTLSKQNDTAGTGMAMGDGGVGELSCGCPTPPCPDATSPYPSFISPIGPPNSFSPYGDIPWVEGPDPNFESYMNAGNAIKEVIDPIDSKIYSLSREITKSHIQQRAYSALVNIDRANPYKLQEGAAGAIGAGASESQRNTTDSLTNMENRAKLYQKKDSIISAFINKN